MNEVVYEILYQGVGILALVVLVLSFQIKDSKKLLLANGLGCVLWAIHFAIAGAYSGVILNLIAVARGFAFAFIKDKKWKITATVLLVIALIAASVSTVLLFDEILFLAIITTIGSGLGTIMFSINNPKMIRWGQLLCISPAWMFYNIWYVSIGGIIGETLNIISVIVSLIRLKHTKKVNA